MQHNKDVDHQYVKMYCVKTQFPESQFFGTHKKTHGVCGLGKNCHRRFDPKLVHFTCAIHRITFACTYIKSMIYQPWYPSVPQHQQPCYQPVKNCTYCSMLGYFKSWDMIQLSHKGTSSEYIDKIIQVVLYRISYNMAELVQTGKYGVINTTDTFKMG